MEEAKLKGTPILNEAPKLAVQRVYENLAPQKFFLTETKILDSEHLYKAFFTRINQVFISHRT